MRLGCVAAGSELHRIGSSARQLAVVDWLVRTKLPIEKPAVFRVFFFYRQFWQF